MTGRVEVMPLVLLAEDLVFSGTTASHFVQLISSILVVLRSCW